jgi:hypothetical protein
MTKGAANMDPSQSPDKFKHWQNIEETAECKLREAEAKLQEV